QIRMTGSCDRNRSFVTSNDSLDQRFSGRASVIGDGKDGRDDGASGMHRALAIAIVELDAVSGSASEKSSVEQVGAPRAARHWNPTGVANGGEDSFGSGCDVAAGAGDHHADGVKQMPACVMADVLGERVVAQVAGEGDQRLGRAGCRLQRMKGFGVRHDTSRYILR